MSDSKGRAPVKFTIDEFEPEAPANRDPVRDAEADKIAAEHGYKSREVDDPEPARKPGRPPRAKPSRSLHISADVSDADAFTALREANGWTSGHALKMLLRAYKAE